MAKKVETKKKGKVNKNNVKKEAPKKKTTNPVEKAADVIKKVDKEKSVKVEKKEIKKDKGLLLATIGIIAVVVLAIVCFIIPENNDNKATRDDKVMAIMTIKDYGDVILELDYSVAPITVDNFLNLANSGAYDGTSFHRVVKDFMIQGGAKDGNLSGEGETTIKGEFESNGVKNDISHVRGVISMARGDDPDSASSQFFICNADSTFLDGYYAAFGRVISGMDIIDKITEDVGTVDQMELVPEEKRPIITSIREIEMSEEE